MPVIARKHFQIAVDEMFHPTTVIVVDSASWDEDGVMVVRVAKDGTADAFRKPVDVAGEVLVWEHQGLITWREGQGWDDERRVIDC